VDDRVKSHRQLEEMSGVPTLASIPSAKARHGLGEHGPYLIEGKLEQGPVTEAYRTMAANILHLASQEELHALMVTSAVAGEGKTAAAANLAVALARLDRLICLVDLDFRAPTVHELFGLDNQIGLTTVLSNARPLEAVINGTEIENLFVIPAGPPIADPAELVARFRDGTYLKQLRKVGAFVILDSPPVLDVADSSILAPATDGVVLVVDGELATRREVRDALEQLRNAGAKIRGTAHREAGTGLAAYYPHEPWKD
jgi:capsular exopolysaccharide synthesis family protein